MGRTPESDPGQMGFEEFAPPKPPVFTHKPTSATPNAAKTDAAGKDKGFYPNGRGEPGDPDYIKPDGRYSN